MRHHKVDFLKAYALVKTKSNKYIIFMEQDYQTYNLLDIDSLENKKFKQKEISKIKFTNIKGKHDLEIENILKEKNLSQKILLTSFF